MNDWNHYKDTQRVVDLLASVDGSVVIPSSAISDFVTHTQAVAGEGDWVPGTVSTAEISAALLDVKDSTSAYIGKEFAYTKHYADAPTRTVLTRPCELFAFFEDRSNQQQKYLYYEAYTSGKQLHITFAGVELDPVTLSGQPGALVWLQKGSVRNNRFQGSYAVLVLYPSSPFAERYVIKDGVSVQLETLTLSGYEERIAVDYARRGESAVLFVRSDSGEFADTTTTGWHLWYHCKVDMVLGSRYLTTYDYNIYDKGFYIADRPKRSSDGSYQFKARDKMTLFDVDVLDAFADSKDTPLSPYNMLNRLASYVEVGYSFSDGADINKSFCKIPSDLESLSGTELLAWLGDAIGVSWRIDEYGTLVPVTHNDAYVELLGQDAYITYDYDDYLCEPISKVLVGSAYAELMGKGSSQTSSAPNAYLQNANKLVTYTSQDDLNRYAQTLCDYFTGWMKPYRAGTVNTYANPDILPGDYLNVVNAEEGTDVFWVHERIETGFVMTLRCTGNQYREAQSYSSQSVSALKQTVTELSQQVGTFPDLWEESIANTVAAITGAMGGTRVDLFKPGTNQPSGTAYLYDSSDIRTAKKLLVMNAGGIAYYDKGFDVDNPANSTPAYVVMDNQGRVNASAIMVGLLTAIRIQSADGVSFWDLATGNLQMQGNFRTVSGSLTADLWGGVFKMLVDDTEVVGLSSVAGTTKGVVNVWDGGVVKASINGGDIQASGSISAGKAIRFNAVRPNDGQNTLYTNWKRGTELTSNDWVLVGSTIAPFSKED